MPVNNQHATPTVSKGWVIDPRLPEHAYLLDHQISGTSYLPGSYLLVQELKDSANLVSVSYDNLIEINDTSLNNLGWQAASSGQQDVIDQGNGRKIGSITKVTKRDEVPFLLKIDTSDHQQTIESNVLYHRLSEQGNNYLNLFQGISQASIYGGGAAALCCPDSRLSNEARIVVLLDCATHICAMAWDIDSTYVPVSYTHLTLPTILLV